MTEKLQQTIQEEIAQLPKEVQDTIATINWVKVAEEVGKGIGLTAEQIEDFQLETLLVLIGAEEQDTYPKNIEGEVGVDTNKANTLAKDASEKIFAPLRKTLDENIKKNLKNKKHNFEQNLDFVLSGGDYTAFVGDTINEAPLPVDKVAPLGTSNVLIMKNKLDN